MKDLYKNEIKIGDLVVFESDRFFTKVAIVDDVSKHAIYISDNGFYRQIYSKNGDNVPVIVLGDFLRNTSIDKSIKIKTN